MTTKTTPKKSASARATTNAKVKAKNTNLASDDSQVKDDLIVKEEIIAEIAYFKAQQRGFDVGHEMEDWLAAEAELAKMATFLSQ
ncbi:DUF2934 domain-containing protein [Rhabdochromatium marinum]|uniref:DUF2934 domain-containing protein n=1 Tax=Rhabdochromatium marinum TaxID=48729 RepID=UPI001904BA5F|nr:DUF2934 domain-containing protein [Rhabdochromatium marinum]MBK1649217.1 hypothetical protein [Rhabdochromatium marinum]